MQKVEFYLAQYIETFPTFDLDKNIDIESLPKLKQVLENLRAQYALAAAREVAALEQVKLDQPVNYRGIFAKQVCISARQQKNSTRLFPGSLPALRRSTSCNSFFEPAAAIRGINLDVSSCLEPALKQEISQYQTLAEF